MSITKLNIGGI